MLGKYKLYLLFLKGKPKIIRKTKRDYRGQSFYKNIQVRVFILDLCNVGKDSPVVLFLNGISSSCVVVQACHFQSKE